MDVAGDDNQDRIHLRSQEMFFLNWLASMGNIEALGALRMRPFLCYIQGIRG